MMSRPTNPYKLPKIRAVTWDIAKQGGYSDGVIIGQAMATELMKRLREVGDKFYAQRLLRDVFAATAEAWESVGGDAMAQKHVTQQPEAFQVVQGARVGLFAVLSSALMAQALANVSLLDQIERRDLNAVLRPRASAGRSPRPEPSLQSPA